MIMEVDGSQNQQEGWPSGDPTLRVYPQPTAGLRPEKEPAFHLKSKARKTCALV